MIKLLFIDNLENIDCPLEEILYRLDNICMNGKRLKIERRIDSYTGYSRLYSEDLAIINSYSLFFTHVECHTHIVSSNILDKQIFSGLRKFYKNSKPLIEII